MFLFRANDLLSGGFTDRLGQSLPGQTMPGSQQSVLQGLSARVLHSGLVSPRINYLQTERRLRFRGEAGGEAEYFVVAIMGPH